MLEEQLRTDSADRVEVLLTRAAVLLDLGFPVPARADLEEALLLAPPGLAAPRLALARLDVAEGHPRRALALLGGAEDGLSLSPAAWFLRAEALRDAGAQETALVAARQGLDLGAPPRPEEYLLVSDLTLSSPGGGEAAAVVVLEAGLSRLGAVPCLVEAALSLDLQRGDEESALRRLDVMDPQRDRADLLVRRGDLLLSWGRIPEAWDAFTEARLALARLPTARRRTPAAVALASHLEDVLLEPNSEETR